MALLATLLGIGLVLFVHELGHFLAARRAGVTVEVFSLGFGPRIAGFKRGDTDYRLSLLPLGGYVLVAGENLEGAPRRGELMAASKSGRLLFFAGGILMNFFFALVLLPLLFGIGVPFEAPVIGSVEPGGAAWLADLRAEDRISELDGRSVHGFRHIATATALSARDEEIWVRGERAGKPFAIQVLPQRNVAMGMPTLGVGPAYEVALIPGGTAIGAGVLDTDRILRINGIPVSDTRAAQAALEDVALSDAPLTLSIERDGSLQDLQIPAAAAEVGGPAQLGVSERQDTVLAVRGALATHLHPGDRLLRAGVVPVQRLSDLLRAAWLAGNLPELTLERDGAILVLPARMDLAPVDLASYLQLGAGPTMRLAVRHGSPAYLAGLRDGDSVLHVDQVAIHNFGDLRTAIAERVALAGADAPPPELVLRVLREDANEPVEIRVTPAPIALYGHGLGLRARSEIVRSTNPLLALRIGLREAWQTAAEVTLTLRRMIAGDIAVTNLGGIISIGQVTHSFASQGLAPLLLFLCVISINLAILNLLPLPGLDGGHMLLLFIETLRRKPVSVRARNAFNLFGFVLVISLLLFVTTLDLRRLFG